MWCAHIIHAADSSVVSLCFFAPASVVLLLSPPLAFYSPALYFSSTSQARFTISIQNHTCSVQLRLKSCCLHPRSSAAVQWQLTLTIQSDKLKIMSQSQFKATVHRKKVENTFFFFFVLCLLVWLHRNTHSPRPAVCMVFLLTYWGQTLDQSQNCPMSLILQTPVCSVAGCAVSPTTGTLNQRARNDPKHISAVIEQMWASQMQTVSSNENGRGELAKKPGANVDNVLNIWSGISISNRPRQLRRSTFLHASSWSETGGVSLEINQVLWRLHKQQPHGLFCQKVPLGFKLQFCYTSGVVNEILSICCLHWFQKASVHGCGEKKKAHFLLWGGNCSFKLAQDGE